MMSTANRRWLRPGFLMAAGILAVTAVVVNVATSALQLHFKKLPVPLVHDLSTVPARLGPWVQVSIDEPLDRETQDLLGTDLYFFRDYVDSRLVDQAQLAAFEGKSGNERHAMAAALQRNRPEAVINCAVTYYTGMVDTVAHIPERCYVANGYVPHDPAILSWNLGPTFDGNDGSHDLQVESIAFDDRANADGVTRVAYCFFADGRWECDSLKVREDLQNLRTTHSFYSKVELRTTIPDAAVSNGVMTDFLRAALPSVRKCYPDWNSVEGRGVPAKGPGRP